MDLKFLKILACVGVFGVSAHAQTRLANQDALRSQYQLSAYPASAPLGLVKVAVLDNGFLGYAPGQGLLPKDAELVAGPLNPLAPDPHGLGMAQILWGLTGRQPNGPKMYLLNSNGFTNLKSAIEYIDQNKIDLVVYSQTWNFGSNFDGSGFVNELINRSTARGTTWLVPAGNHHGLVYNGSVLPLDSSTGFVKLPGQYNTLRLVNRLDSNPVTITLTWNDFTASENYNTSKDLDLFLYNDLGTLVESGRLIQAGQAPVNSDDTAHSSHARESFTATLNQGVYTLKIQPKSRNFEASDRFRVLVETQRPGSVELENHSPSQEMLVPSDNPNVITVGDCMPFSAEGPTARGTRKPDVVLANSEAQFTDGNRTFGTSNATAMLGGIVATLMAQEPSFGAEDLKRYIHTRLRPDSRGQESCKRYPVWRTPSPQELIQITN